MIPWPWNPFTQLGSTAAKIVTDAWIAGWLSLWNAGLWVLRLVLGWMDAWLTPNLTSSGPGHDLYRVTFWLAGVLVLVMVMAQLGLAAIRRSGKSLAQAGMGLGQFLVVVAGWVGYSVTLVAATGGLTRAVMESLMGVTSWRSWDPWAQFDPKSLTDAGVATVLGLMGLLMWIAAIGHLLVILARDAALMVLVAVGPIAAAGLPGENTKAWFWKTFRWLHAAAFTPLLVVMVTGVGMKFAEGVAVGKAGTAQAAIGTALPAVILICISVVSPVALFKLLAFVDPGTASGASLRAGLAATGGLQGLLRGGGTAGGDTSGQAATSQPSGESAGEASADAATSSKVSGAVAAAARFLGPVGAAAAAGIGVMTRVGTVGTSVLTDLTNQTGVGHNTYQPDYQGGPGDGGAARFNREQNGQQADGTDQDPTGGDGDAPGAPSTGGPSGSATDPTLSYSTPPPSSSGGGASSSPAAGASRAGGAGGSSGAAAGGAETAAVAAL